ncbi:MAG: hypothetical protein KDC46_05800 [Thermoleophilia bacterium]|nr:hypothetical protein [Thermoleophilia bacterium]
MQATPKLGLGVKIAAGAVAAAGIAMMVAARNNHSGATDAADDAPSTGDQGTVTTARLDRPVAPTAGTSPGDDPSWPYDSSYPGSGTGTSPGDDPASGRIDGHIDPPGWFDDYTFDGSLDRSRLDMTIDPRGWFNDVSVNGTVTSSSWDTRIDPRGWANDTKVDGHRSGSGYTGTVDRPGLWNDVRHTIKESVRGGELIREGRFDETLVPSFSEASWRSAPAGDGARLLEFDPPGWGNTTRVTITGPAPAGVEATVAAHLFDTWKTALEEEARRQNDYPDTGHGGGTSPGDDSSYPSYPDYPGYPGYPGYPTSPGDSW